MQPDAKSTYVGHTQVRVALEEIASLIRRLVDATMTWDDVLSKYPSQKQSAAGEGA